MENIIGLAAILGQGGIGYHLAKKKNLMDPMLGAFLGVGLSVIGLFILLIMKDRSKDISIQSKNDGDEDVALFRKKMPKDDMGLMVAEIFQSRLLLQYGKVAEVISDLTLGKSEPYFTDKTKAQQLQFAWLFSAAHLAKMRQNSEGSAVADAIINLFAANPDLHSANIDAIKRIAKFPDDDAIFHNVSCQIFRDVFTQYEDLMHPYGSQKIGLCTIDGMELASCLRGIDFVLKDYKIAG